MRASRRSDKRYTSGLSEGVHGFCDVGVCECVRAPRSIRDVVDYLDVFRGWELRRTDERAGEGEKPAARLVGLPHRETVVIILSSLEARRLQPRRSRAIAGFSSWHSEL